MTTYDAVVVGAGPNGLVAANHLLDAGWSVLVLEAQDDVGGAVRSARDVHPGFVHDTFSAFYPLAAASSAMTGLGLERHGLEWRHAPAVLGHPLPDGSWALIHRDRQVTASLLETGHPGDGEAWLRLCDRWDRIGEQLLDAILSPFPPLRSGLAMLLRLPGAGGLGLAKTLLAPAMDVGQSLFSGDAPRILVAGNAAHADIPITSAGSGLMGVLLSMLAQTVGFPVPAGGAGELTNALVRRFSSLGGELRCSAEVAGVDVQGGRATGVRTVEGERFSASQAIVVDLVAPHLYGGLVASADLPARVTRAMQTFQLDPGTVKVDWALDGPVPWASPPDCLPGTVHVADSVEQLAEALEQIACGVVPAFPFLLAGQMTTADPSRSPAGTESMWAYTHVPQRVTHDAGEGGITGTWDRDDNERFADRMQSRIEALAPGFGARVLARRVLGPRDLEALDANLIGGSINGGTARLRQQGFLRPIPGLGRAETPIRGLYLGSASAHPGGGVHGACGMNAARAALAHARVRRVVAARWATPRTSQVPPRATPDRDDAS